jgi:small RNA 2'-O-methyltransferase
MIKIISSNPNLSYILRKNPKSPTSGTQIKSIRQGYGIGWYSGENEYCMAFEDQIDGLSFPIDVEDSFEYLDTTRYNSPFVICHLLKAFCGSVFKEVMDKDALALQRVQLPFVYVNKPYHLVSFQKSLLERGINLEVQNIVHNTYSLNFVGEVTMSKMLNAVDLLCFILALSLHKSIYKDDSLATKYTSKMVELDLPYMLRYLFKINLFFSSNLFEKHKELLSTSNKWDLKLLMGTNWDQRFACIKSLLLPDTPILDYGFGEGKYSLRLARQYSVLGVDIDESLVNNLQQKAQSKQLPIKAYSSLESLLQENTDLSDYQIICSEVLEHMPYTNSIELLQKLLDLNSQKLIITMPNREFNHNYFFEDNLEQNSDTQIEAIQKRHEDHDWEPNQSELQAFLATSIQSAQNKYTMQVTSLGDSVDNCQPTFLIIFEKIN